MDCENCRHLTVVRLHNAGPWAANTLPVLWPVQSMVKTELYCHLGSQHCFTALAGTEHDEDSFFFFFFFFLVPSYISRLHHVG